MIKDWLDKIFLVTWRESIEKWLDAKLKTIQMKRKIER